MLKSALASEIGRRCTFPEFAAPRREIHPPPTANLSGSNQSSTPAVLPHCVQLSDGNNFRRRCNNRLPATVPSHSGYAVPTAVLPATSPLPAIAPNAPEVLPQ